MEGGSETVDIDFSGRFAWDACPNAEWLSVEPTHGVGDVMFMVTDYYGDGTARTGYIEVGDKQVRITQRAYELSISPSSLQVKGNAGEGEIGVSATLGEDHRREGRKERILLDQSDEVGETISSRTCPYR